MIRARNLHKSYEDGEGRTMTVLDGAELEVREGEFVAIVGPSGCGKSTLLNILGGLDVAYRGEVEVAGERIDGAGARRLAQFRNRTVGFVFQSYNLLAPLTALENVTLPASFGAPQGSDAELKARALDCLERVGLKEKAQRKPAQLSGGERQRVAIARALFGSPRLILCDEPTGNLDAKTGGEVIAFFTELVRAGKQTLVVVTHEERVSQAADRVLRLRDGKLVEERRGAEAAG